MNKNLMRSNFTVMVLLCACSIGFAQTNDWSKRIVSKTTRPLASFINPHVSPIQVLIIDGKRFENVRGQEKYYLQVPKTNSIVFVTEEIDFHPVYHIFNMDTDEDIEIRPYSFRFTNFGKDIGSPYPNSSDTVTVGDDGIVVLCNLDKNFNGKLASIGDFESVKQLIYLDPNKKAIVGGKSLYYDKNGKLIYEDDAIPPF
jgi:hypothetical protein